MYEIFEQLLQKYGVSAYKVAKATGVTQSTLSDQKRGRSTPKSENMKKLADYFGVSIDYLMTGKEEAEKEPKLKPKDQKDIKEILANTEQLLKQDGLTSLSRASPGRKTQSPGTDSGCFRSRTKYALQSSHMSMDSKHQAKPIYLTPSAALLLL